MPLTNSIKDPAYEMGQLVGRTLLYERILPNKNVGDVVNPGVASKASEFEFTQSAHEKNHQGNLNWVSWRSFRMWFSNGMVMVTFATTSLFALILDSSPLSCNQTVCGIGKPSALVTNGILSLWESLVWIKQKFLWSTSQGTWSRFGHWCIIRWQKKGEEPLMVAKGKDSGASFDFTAVDAFNLLSPDND